MNHIPPTLDMKPDGSFRVPSRTTTPLSFKLMAGAIMVALVAGAIAFAALALWIFSMLLPVVVAAGLFAWAMMRFRRWQALRGARSVRPY